MGYNLLINGIYWGYNPFTNHLLTSWDIQVSVYEVSRHVDAWSNQIISAQDTDLIPEAREGGKVV